MAGEPVWTFRRPHFRFDPQPYAEAGLHLGFNHPALGHSDSAEWATAVIEWEPGSADIGDFAVLSVPVSVIARREVGEKLMEMFRGIELGPVDFWQSPKLDKVKRPRTPRVLLPYQGPPLCYLYATHEVPLDLERSTVKVTRDPDGTVALSEFKGIERLDLVGTFPSLSTVRVPRTPGEGMFFRERDLRSADLWQLPQPRAWAYPGTYCRDRVKRFIEEAGYTNVKFLEVGEIVDE